MRLVPSKAREAIRTIQPGIDDEHVGHGALATVRLSLLRATLDLVEEIPSELLRLNPDDYGRFIVARAAIRSALEHVHPGVGPDAARIKGMDGRTPVGEIYRLLGVCPDEAPIADAPPLTFVTDAALREGLRIDISTAESALINHEYKAATVLAGSVVEALLLDRVSPIPIATIRGAVPAGAPGAVEIHSKLPVDWGLHSLAVAARALGIASANTVDQILLAKDFRNLIHPGRAQRTNAQCNLGTAHAALAAAHLLITELANAPAAAANP